MQTFSPVIAHPPSLPPAVPPSRVLNLEQESEDEETILERRRQLRQAIVQKYRVPGTEASSLAVSPTRSRSASADSVTVGDVAAQDLELTIQEEEERLKEKGEEVEGEAVKKEEDGGEEEAEKARVRSSLQAMKAAVRNGDMFTEGDMFGEKYLVSRAGKMEAASTLHAFFIPYPLLIGLLLLLSSLPPSLLLPSHFPSLLWSSLPPSLLPSLPPSLPPSHLFRVPRMLLPLTMRLSTPVSPTTGMMPRAITVRGTSSLLCRPIGLCSI